MLNLYGAIKKKSTSTSMISLMQLFAMYRLYRENCNNVYNTRHLDPLSRAVKPEVDSDTMALCGDCDAPLCDMGRLSLEHNCPADYDNTGDRTSNMKHAGAGMKVSSLLTAGEQQEVDVGKDILQVESHNNFRMCCTFY